MYLPSAEMAQRVVKGKKKTSASAFNAFMLTHLNLASHKSDTDKQYRPRSDATEGVYTVYNWYGNFYKTW